MVRKIIPYTGWAGILALFVALSAFMIQTTWGMVSYILAALSVLFIVAWAVTHLEDIKKVLGLRQTRYGANMIVVIITVMAILVVVNYLGTIYHKKWDTTASSEFSLSDQSVKILKGLTDDVQVTIFEKDASQNRYQLEDLLPLYAYHSSKFKYTFVDPDKNPGITQNYGVKSYGTIVLEHGEKLEKITNSREEDITNALIKVLKETKQVIYFLVGHAERDLEDSEARGYSKAQQGLQDQNYEVKSLNLLTEPQIPADCNVLVVAGPEKGFQSFELKEISRYLRGGGKGLFLLDPEKNTKVEDILREWNVRVNDDVVVDVSGMGKLFQADEFMPVAMEYGTHTITSNFKAATLFPYSRSVEIEEAAMPGITISELVKTGPRSWAESEPGQTQIKFDQDSDRQGPISIALAIEADVPDSLKSEIAQANEKGELKTRLVVAGDSDFSANTYYDFSGNRDLFLNMVSWLAEMEDLISIRPKSPEDSRINLTPGQVAMVRLLSLIFLPLASIIAGIMVWWRRRG